MAMCSITLIDLREPFRGVRHECECDCDGCVICTELMAQKMAGELDPDVIENHLDSCIIDRRC